MPAVDQEFCLKGSKASLAARPESAPSVAQLKLSNRVSQRAYYRKPASLSEVPVKQRINSTKCTISNEAINSSSSLKNSSNSFGNDSNRVEIVLPQARMLDQSNDDDEEAVSSLKDTSSSESRCSSSSISEEVVEIKQPKKTLTESYSIDQDDVETIIQSIEEQQDTNSWHPDDTPEFPVKDISEDRASASVSEPRPVPVPASLCFEHAAEEGHFTASAEDLKEMSKLATDGASLAKSRNSMASGTISVCSFTTDTTAEEEKTTSTYGDILKAIEALESNSPEKQEATNDPVPQQTNTERISEKSPDKISELFSYLNSVESEGSVTVTRATGKASPKKMNKEIEDLSKEHPRRLAEKLVHLRLSSEEQSRALGILRQAWQRQTKVISGMHTKFEKELEHRLHQQKEEYEATVQRHQTFIDQLIDDKRGLSERCDLALNDLKNVERKYEENARNMEHRHAAELRRLKSLNDTSIKLKQEKWLDEKTKRIKEQTVRGLEPEIQRLMSRHSSELADMEAERERQLMNLEKELHQRHVQHVRELRALWEEEQHESLQRERQMLMQRHNTHLNELRDQQNEELSRLQDQLCRERQRSVEDREHFQQELAQNRKSNVDRANQEIDRIREEEENKRRLLKKKHAAELALLKENEAADRANWEKECRKQLDEEWREKESKLAGKFKFERDEELDKVVEKLEAQVNKEKVELQKEMDETIKRLRDKNDFALKEYEDESKAIREKLQNVREEAGKTEEMNIVLRATIKQKEILVDELQQNNQRLESERNDIRNSVRGEFATALEALSQERSTLLAESADLRLQLAGCRSERASLERELRTEMEQEALQIHNKIKAILCKKEEHILELKEALEASQGQAEHLEELLEQQTKEKFLSPGKMKKV